MLAVAVVVAVVVIGARVARTDIGTGTGTGIGIGTGVTAQTLPKNLVVVPDPEGFNIVVMSSTTIRVAKGFGCFLDLSRVS